LIQIVQKILLTVIQYQTSETTWYCEVLKIGIASKKFDLDISKVVFGGLRILGLVGKIRLNLQIMLF
jgi:hypothetical protein